MQIIILGMHRSGTSVAARLVNMMGAYFAPEGLEMPPRPDNPKGFWERVDVVQLNDAILEASNCTWHRIDGLDLEKLPPPHRDEFAERIRHVVLRLDAHRPWMLKDPRMCLTFPLWRPWLEASVCIFVHRNPLEIARSLERRNGLSLEAGLALWERYTGSVLSAAAGLPILRISHAHLIANPVGMAAWLHERLGEFGVTGLRMPGRREILAFVDRELVHEKDEADEVGRYLTPSQVDLLGMIEAEVPKPAALWACRKAAEHRSTVCAGEADPGRHASAGPAMAELDVLREELEAERHLRHSLQLSMDALLAEKQLMEVRLVEYSGEIPSLRTALETAESEKARLLQAVDSREQYIMQLKHWLAGLEGDLAAIFKSWRWRVGHSAVTAVERLMLRGKMPLARDHAEFVLQEFRRCNPLIERIEYARASGAVPVTLPASLLEEFSSKEAFSAIKAAELDSFLAGSERLALPRSDTPTTSIILILYNRAELTFACLKSICNTVQTPVEVIIVDNASSDRTGALLERVDGARVVRNADNVGFLRACNQAARLATGEFVLLLNNDAQLLPGSLEAAEAAFRQSADIGAVGGKILLLDGSLQEAGSIVWRDGSCLGYGRSDSPFRPEYMFRRDVDYCSGAFLLTPRALYQELGGFDERYAPAYYEETDYCMRLRERGLRTVYEPDAVIMHYEFASSGSSDAAIEMQKRNQRIFLDRHEGLLADHFPPDLGNVLKARCAQRRRKRVLYIDDRVPHRSFGSGCPRANQTLHSLVSRDCLVTLYPLNFPLEDQWSTAYSDIPREVEIMLGYGRARLAEFLEQRRGHYDVIMVSRPHNMTFFNRTIERRPELVAGAKLIYDSEAIFSLRDKVARELQGAPMSAAEVHQAVTEELDVARNADAVFVVSHQERETYLQHGFTNVKVLGHAVDIRPTSTPFEGRRHILFVGNLDYDESPNADSLDWFVHEVFPLILQRMPDQDVELHVVGSADSKRVKALAGARVRLHGRVDDIDAFYETSRIFIAPTRFAAGIPLKLQEAASRGIPSVATTLLAAQLGWAHGTGLLAADAADAAGFAQHCVDLYSKAELWQTVRDGALSCVRDGCAVEAFTATLCSEI